MSVLKSARMRRFLSRAVALFIFGASPAAAGGTSYEVRVTEFQPGEGAKARIVVEGAAEDVMPGCRVVEVIAAYRVRRWPWSAERTFTREAHAEALKRLREAFESRAVTKFGIMGSGLAHDPSDGACVFRSRGLALLEENPGVYAVYSVYKYP